MVDGSALWHRGDGYKPEEVEDYHQFTGIEINRRCDTPLAKTNLARAAACVNACKGFIDPETTVPELLEALKDFQREMGKAALNQTRPGIRVLNRLMIKAGSAIAKAESRQPETQHQPISLLVARAEGRVE